MHIASTRNKFRNLIKRVPPGHDLDEVRARVIRGQALDQVLLDMNAVSPAARYRRRSRTG